MKKKNDIAQIIRLYKGSIFDITRYQIVSSLLSYGTAFLFSRLALYLIRSSGHAAISSGDFTFLFKTWQGPLLIIIALIVLFFYMAFDLNIEILYAAKYLKGKADLFASIKEGLFSLKQFFTPDGIGILIYIALIAPIIGFGFTISLTDNLYIPSFITSVIFDNTLYYILYLLFVLFFILLGLMNIFTLHGVLLSSFKSYKADDDSRKMIKENWKDFLKAHLYFALSYLIVLILIFLLFLFLPAVLSNPIIKNEKLLNTVSLHILLMSFTAFLFISGCFKFFYIIMVTRRYFIYKNIEITYPTKTNRRKSVIMILSFLIVFFLFLLASFVLIDRFDEIFRKDINTKVIAHRAGGVHAPENTLAGLNKAIALKADGAEIDVQRSKDGYYIINHDSSFTRLCSNAGKPEEMTLEEIRQLIISDPLFPNDPHPVATLEEMMDTAKGKILLFIELKGNSADQKMAEDLVALIKEKDMQQQCILISLKYSLIDYIETTHPEINTGYLTFAAFGKIGDLHCDYVGLEEEAASDTAIASLHEAGKKVMVWTPNSESGQKKFLLSEADFIITDRILQAEEMIASLNAREDLEVIIDLLLR